MDSKKPKKKSAAKKPSKTTKRSSKAAPSNEGKLQAARMLSASQRRTDIAKIMQATPNIQWGDGDLEPKRKPRALAGTPAVVSGPPIGIVGQLTDASLPPDAMYGKLKVSWAGVDVRYRTTTTTILLPSQPLLPSIELNGEAGNTSVQLRSANDKFVHLGELEGKAGLWIGVSDRLPGRMVVRAGNSEGRIVLDAVDSSIAVRAPGGGLRARLAPTAAGSGLQLFDTNGVPLAYLGTFGSFAGLALGKAGVPGRIELSKGNLTPEIVLDANSGDIVLMNADCAEEFDVSDPTVEPGTVLVLGDGPGCLRSSATAYDTRVAGVVSGAGGYRPGILLDRQEKSANRRPVALVGKVFCRVEADSAPIRPGTLLTTSAEAGCAMAATDRERAFGAVLGKALAGLDRGRGLLPVLVALQ